MLTVYRRHLKSCPHRAEGRKYRRCKCSLWVDGWLGGVEIRRALGLQDWQRAQDLVRRWEADGQCKADPEPLTLAQIWARFLADVEARKLHSSTVRKYRLLAGQMQQFADLRGLHLLAQFDLDTVSAFRAEWRDGPRSSLKKLERLRAFFRFAQRRKWVRDNPASELKVPKVSLCPTLPFTHDEMTRILAALDAYSQKTAPSGRDNARRMRALVLLLRYSGMRVSDVVGLSTDRINGNHLFVYTQKTGVPVYTILPDFVLRVLETTPRATENYFFWSGAGKLESAVRSWQTRLRKLFQLAKVAGGHAHRFRDTFAGELLLAGVPIERVSVLLGHSSVRVTERHYNPWVRSRQEQLEADIQRAWSRDPNVLLEAKNTKDARAN